MIDSVLNMPLRELTKNKLKKNLQLLNRTGSRSKRGMDLQEGVFAT